MTNVAPISHRKGAEKSSDKINPSTSTQILNKVEDFNNIVVMSGTATRKSLEKKESHSDIKQPVQKTTFKDSILKLRAPFYKSHHKQAPSEEKLMTKSCEILLGCIKPYKDIRVAKKTKVTESIRIGSVLQTTNIVYERKATRKVHFFSFSEENPSFLWNTEHPPVKLLRAACSAETENEYEGDCSIFKEIETSPNHAGRTVSSEDFITKVFPQAMI